MGLGAGRSKQSTSYLQCRTLPTAAGESEAGGGASRPDIYLMSRVGIRQLVMVLGKSGHRLGQNQCGQMIRVCLGTPL